MAADPLMQTPNAFQRCDLCGGTQTHEVVRLPGRSLSTDGRITPLGLVKVACDNCGLIRSGSDHWRVDPRSHYGEGYQLGVRAAGGEPNFMTAAGPITSSEAMADWIDLALASLRRGAPKSLVEVGCGGGHLLYRLVERWHVAQHFGVDPDMVAVGAARERGLNVVAGIATDIDARFEAVVSVAVIEHTQSPRTFLRQLKSMLLEGGFIVLVLPVQDGGNRDILFWDHLYHFHSDHIRLLAAQEGLEIAWAGHNHPLHAGFGLFVLMVNENVEKPALGPEAQTQPIAAVINAHHALVERLNVWLKARKEPISVFGLGETFDMLVAYSDLGRIPIVSGFDSNLDRALARRPSYPVMRPDPTSLAEAAALLVTFSPSQVLQEQLDALGIPVFTLMDANSEASP